MRHHQNGPLRLLLVVLTAAAAATGGAVAFASPAPAAIAVPLPPLPVPLPPLPPLPLPVVVVTPTPPSSSLPDAPDVGELVPPLPLPPLPLPPLPPPLSDFLGGLPLQGALPPLGGESPSADGPIPTFVAAVSSAATSVVTDLAAPGSAVGSTAAATRAASNPTGEASTTATSTSPSAGDLPGGGAGDADEQRRAQCFVATVNGGADVPQCDPLRTRQGVAGARGADESSIQVLGAFAHTGAAVLGTAAFGVLLIAVGAILLRVRRSRVSPHGRLSASTR
jgi:hypothetical protein